MSTDIQLECVDCLKGMARLPERSIDLVVTSPPYNLGIAYQTYRDDLDRDAYLDWSEQWMRAVRRVLSEPGSFFLNIGGSPKNPLLPHELILRAARCGFVLQNTFHWIKSITLDGDGETVSRGHFKPIQSKRYVNDCHEYLFHLTRTGEVELDRLAVGVAYQDKSNIARWGHTGGKDRRCRGNTWFIPYKTIKSRDRERPHPATFPVQLPAQCIRLHGREKVRAMLDPFVGIGHSALAAKECEIPSFIGFDIDSHYLAVAREALATLL